MPPDPNGSWDEYRMFVVQELKGLRIQAAETHKLVDKNHTDIAMLKVRAGIWGLVGAAIPVGMAVVAKMMGVL